MNRITDYLAIIAVLLLIPLLIPVLLLLAVYLALRFMWRRSDQVGPLILAATLVFIAVQSYYTREQANSMSKQAEILAKQADLLGNQTSLLASQTQLQQSDYVNRTRPYLRLVGITVQDGNSSEVLDVLLELQNCGQVPATKAWLGEREGGEVGIYIGADDLEYNESIGKFTAAYTGECMPSLYPESSQSPPSTPVEQSHGTSINITITATPCWLAAINQTGVPKDQIFYPGISANQIIRVNKSTFNKATNAYDTMQIGLKYYGEGHVYYYIATLKKTADNTWAIQPIERGN